MIVRGWLVQEVSPPRSPAAEVAVEGTSEVLHAALPATPGIFGRRRSDAGKGVGTGGPALQIPAGSAVCACVSGQPPLAVANCLLHREKIWGGGVEKTP